MYLDDISEVLFIELYVCSLMWPFMIKTSRTS
jgi:hypothetical protein